jgi:hypothetical protein
MKILLAIDSSTASQHVLDRAATRPWPSGTTFCVMTVVDVGRLERPPILVEETIHEAQSLVKSATAKFERRDLLDAKGEGRMITTLTCLSCHVGAEDAHVVAALESGRIGYGALAHASTHLSD